MSTYVIASAIEKFAKDFKEVISEKNKIEKEKLAFEKEKFEFNKRQLDLSENTFNTEKHNDEVSCNHYWKYECTIHDITGCKEFHRCAKCGETRIVEAQAL